MSPIVLGLLGVALLVLDPKKILGGLAKLVASATVITPELAPTPPAPSTLPFPPNISAPADPIAAHVLKLARQLQELRAAQAESEAKALVDSLFAQLTKPPATVPPAS
jgi:hypothetical protein